MATEIGPTVALADWRAVSFPVGMSTYPEGLNENNHYLKFYHYFSCDSCFTTDAYS